MWQLKQNLKSLIHLTDQHTRRLFLGIIPAVVLLGVLMTPPLFAGRTAEAETLMIANTPTERVTQHPKRVAYFQTKKAPATTPHAQQLKATANNQPDPITPESDKWGWPYTGGQYITSTFGKRDLADSPWHDGLDFDAGVGSKIHAVHAGKVIFVGNPTKRGVSDAYPLGLGKDVVVTETAGGDQIVYQEFAMQKQTHTVHVGETVKTGQVIAVQASGHLHLGVTNHKDWVTAQDDWQNPAAHSWQNPLKLIKASA